MLIITTNRWKNKRIENVIRVTKYIQINISKTSVCRMKWIERLWNFFNVIFSRELKLISQFHFTFKWYIIKPRIQTRALNYNNKKIQFRLKKNSLSYFRIINRRARTKHTASKKIISAPERRKKRNFRSAQQ